ncbi:hypothetical protein ElyMa_006548900 [Elysia marginata]|uniref:Uncharacterized protein n=1 Tax=Elysia marginata TaxID=1093978 RepID=A0AAV4IBV0_9GAST|nr:hypothetical protein ElyMa_006548900 [Elysia marginata]
MLGLSLAPTPRCRQQQQQHQHQVQQAVMAAMDSFPRRFQHRRSEAMLSFDDDYVHDHDERPSLFTTQAVEEEALGNHDCRFRFVGPPLPLQLHDRGLKRIWYSKLFETTSVSDHWVLLILCCCMKGA